MGLDHTEDLSISDVAREGAVLCIDDEGKEGVTQDVGPTAEDLLMSWLSSLRQSTSPRSVPHFPPIL